MKYGRSPTNKACLSPDRVVTSKTAEAWKTLVDQGRPTMSTRRRWTSGRRTGIPVSKWVGITEARCPVQSLLLASSSKCMTTQAQPSPVISIVIPMEAMKVDHARRHAPSYPCIERPERPRPQKARSQGMTHTRSGSLGFQANKSRVARAGFHAPRKSHNGGCRKRVSGLVGA
jgi:hypothetical protein